MKHYMQNSLANKNNWQISVGDFRIIYSKHEQVLIIEIIKIANRKDAYK